MNTGCLVALIVVGVLGLLVLGSVAALGYFLTQTFEFKDHEFSDAPVNEVPAETMSSEEASAAFSVSAN
ncbi:hypothetical protein ABI_19590 [Asticcacaulis biprosthecium C19]|uniref:Uncharacterized protein n=2 Tax=Asticcacaulis biprosthecium TaxID=76891 RepID=F4QLM1_9CAUL|nr:hypothetical protein ABI_19590 [Asticcacaulis biprosthecium C19]